MYISPKFIVLTHFFSQSSSLPLFLSLPPSINLPHGILYLLIIWNIYPCYIDKNIQFLKDFHMQYFICSAKSSPVQTVIYRILVTLEISTFGLLLTKALSVSLKWQLSALEDIVSQVAEIHSNSFCFCIEKCENKNFLNYQYLWRGHRFSPIF